MSRVILPIGVSVIADNAIVPTTADTMIIVNRNCPDATLGCQGGCFEATQHLLKDCLLGGSSASVVAGMLIPKADQLWLRNSSCISRGFDQQDPASAHGDPCYGGNTSLIRFFSNYDWPTFQKLTEGFCPVRDCNAWIAAHETCCDGACELYPSDRQDPSSCAEGPAEPAEKLWSTQAASTVIVNRNCPSASLGCQGGCFEASRHLLKDCLLSGPSPSVVAGMLMPESEQMWLFNSSCVSLGFDQQDPASVNGDPCYGGNASLIKFFSNYDWPTFQKLTDGFCPTRDCNTWIEAHSTCCERNCELYPVDRQDPPSCEATFMV